MLQHPTGFARLLWTAVLALALVMGCDDGDGTDATTASDATETDDAVTSPSDVGDDDVTSSADATTPSDATGEDAADMGNLPAGAMVRYEVRDASGRDAVCNNGTPAVYYHRYGQGENRDKWVLYLKGGSGCFSPEECEARWMRNEDLMNSDHTRWGDVLQFEGLLSGDPALNPDFHDWSVVYMVYCSSDGWAGDAQGGDMLGEWHFRGHRIARAIVEDLSDASLFPDGHLSTADSVLVAGSSAGASGLRAHIDWIAESLAMVGVTDVRGLHDAGWYPDVYPAESLATIRDALIAGIQYTNAQLDADCIAATAEADRWRCIDGYHVAPYIDTPLFVYMDQIDPVDMGRVFRDKNDPADQAVFQAGVVELVTGLDGCFSPNAASHEGAIGDGPWTGENRVDGLAFNEVFGNWYFGRDAPTCAIERP